MLSCIFAKLLRALYPGSRDAGRLVADILEHTQAIRTPAELLQACQLLLQQYGIVGESLEQLSRPPQTSQLILIVSGQKETAPRRERVLRGLIHHYITDPLCLLPVVFHQGGLDLIVVVIERGIGKT